MARTFFMSRYEKAIDYFEQARSISRSLKDRGGEGNALNGLGAASRLLGRAEADAVLRARR